MIKNKIVLITGGGGLLGSELAKKILDWEPSIKIEDGLKKTLQYEFLEDNSDKPIFYSE